MPLSDKQKMFCEQYLVDFNATQAAIRAGYSKHTARGQGQRLLTKAAIQKYIQGKQQKIADKFEITQEKILQEYARIAYADIRNFYTDDNQLKNIRDLGDVEAAALAGVEVDELWGGSPDGRIQIGETKKIKRWDKIKALDSICRVLGFNAPDKISQTDKEGNDIPQPKLTDQQFALLIKTINETAKSG